MLLGLCLGWPARSEALRLPVRARPDRQEQRQPGPRGGPLQEVAPPPLVQELRRELAGHDPRIRILAPADDSLLPPGPWTLRLAVDDWPLVSAGAPGLGPHLVVQLDDEPPVALSATELAMPALRPGSHRLTVYAARPWGEAVKSPGAYRQIHLHRVAANPLSVPAPGTPQLIAVRPDPAPQREPVLLDWLLLEAPLQNIRGAGTEGWRLRVTVNGDSFLVDQQTPLWLSGWRQGENALQLELVDGRGAPLNPPFNALVSAVTVSAQAPPLAWQGSSLTPGQRQRLLGLASGDSDGRPAEPAAQADPGDSTGSGAAASSAPSDAEAEAEAVAVEAASADADADADNDGEADNEGDAEDDAAEQAPATSGSAGAVKTPAELERPLPPEPRNDQATVDATAPPSPLLPGNRLEKAPEPMAGVDATGAAAAVPVPTAKSPQPPAPPPDSPSAPRRPVTPMPPAREQVNPDGTLIRPAPRGPLTQLRERLGR